MNHVDSQHKNNSLPLSLLEEVYLRLGYQDGVLLDATHEPIAANKDAWVEKGGWLSLANEVGAEKILFVNNDPVFVFYKFDTEPDIQTQIDTFRRVWCMARPQCLFMAFPGELRVYNLKQAPSRNELEWKKVRPLAVVKQVADVAEELKAYRRERVESGQLFGDARFGGVDQRADKRLIQDLKTVRRSLRKEGKEGLELRYAHTLIGRSIFIRYLEDRKVLTLEYFQKIASANSDWQAVLSNVLEKPEFSEEQSEHFYTRVLKDKAFTFALFRQLTRDFNGDMFPEDEGEEAAIDQNHLTLLRQFLLGDSGSQQSLFFWAYNFEIIPIDLISSLYEEFYHEDNGDDDKGTHYTPSVLVEYVLSQVLDEKTLESRPKILDPACGSGIFLVEAFRRIVRYNVQKIGRLLTSDELRDILKNQLRGFEINGEAIRVAAFSLYLALLHYQEPSDILRSKKLPNLIYEKDENFSTYYNILFNTNTFALMSAEREELKTRLDENGKFAGRSAIEALYNSIDILPVMPNSFDVIIGNPPWGFVRGVSSEIQQAQVQAEQWSAAFGWTIGDKEPSQTFIARTFSLLKTGGVCGLLISTGIFFKHHENSREFRQSWLAKSTVEKVVNFVHVRHTFFSANSPFAFVLYHTEPAQSSHTVQYWSVKKTKFVDNVQIVILDSVDLRQVKQLDLLSNDYLWKVYWWGSHRDAAFISRLRFDTNIEQLARQQDWQEPRQGFTPGSAVLSDWLLQYKQLPVGHFHSYGPVDRDTLKPVPERVHRRGSQYLYHGWRILIKRGISQAKGVNGRVESRLVQDSFSVSNSIHGINLAQAEDWERKVLIGVLWSSLARYYYFMTASSWGTWHHEIHLKEAVSLPIRFPEDIKLRNRITEVVDELQAWSPKNESLFGLLESLPEPQVELALLEQELNEAIYELYQLTLSERDLVKDMCETGLEFFYNHANSIALKELEHAPNSKQGYQKGLQADANQQQGLEGYLYTFLQIWNRELQPEGEFSWQVIRPDDIPMVAIVFSTQEAGTKLLQMVNEDAQEWADVLARCSSALLQPISRRIFIDGMVRVVSDTEIIIIKRNERRLWTRSLAREDAEATLLQAIHLQAEVERESVQ